MKKKILFFLPSLMGGGAERTFVNLLNHLDRTEYEPVLLLLSKPENGLRKDAYSKLLLPDVRCINLDIRLHAYNYPKMLLGILRVIRQENPDILLSTTIKANLLTSWASRLSRTPHKLVLRESNNQSIMGHGPFFNGLIMLMYRFAADRIITPSRGLKAMLHEHYHVPNRKISVIPNMLDLDLIHSRMKEKTILAEDSSFKIVTAGRLEPQKDHATLLKALHLLPADLDYICYILGEGSLQDQIERSIKEYGLSDKVTLMGFQDNPYSYIHDADLFVLSSRWEGIANVLLESLAVGTAPVSTDCPFGPREVLDNRPDLLYPVGDENALCERILAFAKDHSKSKIISDWGLVQVQNYLPGNITKQYGNLFDSL